MVIGLRLYSLFNDSEPTERGFLDVMGSLSQTPVRCLKKKKKKLLTIKLFVQVVCPTKREQTTPVLRKNQYTGGL